MKPPQEQQEFWQNVAGASPFNNSAVSHLRISDMDEIRQEDGQGRKTLDGFQMTWEGIIPKGASKQCGVSHNGTYYVRMG